MAWKRSNTERFVINDASFESVTAAGPSRNLTEVPCFRFCQESAKSAPCNVDVDGIPLALKCQAVKNSGMRTQIIIPARLASSRLPKKLLRTVAGRTVLHWTHQAAIRCELGEPIVAVDDQQLADEVQRFGGRSVMTSVDCPSGTDRIAEAIETLSRSGESLGDDDIVVNVQGDEPEIAPEAVQKVARLMQHHPNADMATIATPIRDAAALADPGVVKIAMDFFGDIQTGQGRAAYFSRSVVPADRDAVVDLQSDRPVYWHHLGLYAYRVSFLRWFASAPVSGLERTEKLEQLRAIAAGKTILVAAVDGAASGIDTEADLAAFDRRIAAVKR